MVNIFSHLVNAGQNYIEIPSHTSHNIIKKMNNNRCWQGCRGKGTLTHCWWECRLAQALWKSVWRFLKKLKIEVLPSDPTVPLLVYPREKKSAYYRDTQIPIFSRYYSQRPSCGISLSIHRWIKKM
jgi:hypothetical protein